MSGPSENSAVLPHVVVVDDLPTPYRVNLFRDVAALETVRLSVVYLSEGHGKEWRLNLDDLGFDVHHAKSFQRYVKSVDTLFQLSWGAGRVLKMLRPDIVVVGGYHHPGYWRCLLYCRWHRVPLIVWSGSTLESEWRARIPLVRAMKRFFVRRADSAFAYGSAAGRLLVVLGMDPGRIINLYNSTDLQAFRRRWLADAASSNNADAAVKFLFTGRITPFKGLQRTFAALSKFRQRDFRFRIVGDGHYRAEAERLVARLDLADRVEFVGYVQQDRLVEHLTWADVFIFTPVQEVWGIVVNEALATGLFVLSSTLAGVTEDLIVPKFTGLPVDPLSEAAISEGLAYCMDNIHTIRTQREERSRWVLQFSTQETRHEFIRGVLRASQQAG